MGETKKPAETAEKAEEQVKPAAEKTEKKVKGSAKKTGEAAEKKAKSSAKKAAQKDKGSEAPAAAKAEKPYFAGIDIVKILAVFLVVCIHFFLYNGFYYVPLTNSSAYGPIAFRWIAYTCVPLFMISTGYLMKNKTFSAKFYKGLIRIIVIYIIISIICFKFKEHHYHQEFKWWDILKGYLNYDGAQYGWYINYYISIFLIIPFLNLAINGCKTKGQKFFLMMAVVLTTIVARSFFLGFHRETQIRALPDQLNGAWPVAYYFIGAFIRDCPPKKNLRNKLIILAWLALSIWFITYSTYRQTIADEVNDHHFLSWHFNDYGTYPVCAVATCIFLLLFDITTRNKGVKFVLRQISGVTLGTYLMSYVFDNMFYNGWQWSDTAKHHQGFNEKYAEVGDRLAHWYAIIPKVFICALISGLIIHKLYDLGAFLVNQGVEAIKAEKAATTEE